MKMNLKEMEAFAALTDKERRQKIWLEKHRKEAQVAFFEEQFGEWKGRDTDYNQGASCGCSNTMWKIIKQVRKIHSDEFDIYFDINGKIIMDDYVLDCLPLGEIICDNCGNQPKMPEWYLEQHVELVVGFEEEEEE